MAENDGTRSWMMVNRAPVLTLWAGVVAEVLGFEHNEALPLWRRGGRAERYSKGVSLGLLRPTSKEVKYQSRKMRKEEKVTIDLLHRQSVQPKIETPLQLRPLLLPSRKPGSA